MIGMNQPQSCQNMLASFMKMSVDNESVKLSFECDEGYDVYNIAAPFLMNGREIIAARVERRDSEHSKVMFFEQNKEKWAPITGAPILTLQDPFVTKVNEEWIIGGVSTITDPDDPEHILSWVTKFYRGITLDQLQHFATGPDRMKDIRLLQLTDGKIFVCTRPQGVIGGRGQIGLTIIDTLDQLTIERIEKAHIYTDQFLAEEWGGANELHQLNNGMVGILGHIACFDEEGNRHYYSMTFAINPYSYERTAMKIIATRAMFLAGPTKRDDLIDVLFSGGIIRLEDGQATLYTGVSDAEAHYIHIVDPFIEYEELAIATPTV